MVKTQNVVAAENVRAQFLATKAAGKNKFIAVVFKSIVRQNGIEA
jgi:hypothetical protein